MLTCNSSLLDGINRHILTVAPALQRLGAEVAVCTTHPSGELNAALGREGVRTFSLNAPNGHALPLLWRFWRVLRVFRPDIVHGHVTSLLVGLVCRVAGRACRYVETVHGIADPRRRWWGRGVAWLFKPKVRYACYVSEGVRTAAKAPEGAAVVHNPLTEPPVGAVGALQARLGLPPDTRCVGTACRLAAVKDPEAFTRVFCSVLRQRADAQAVIMGDGDDNLIQRCWAIVRANGLGGRIHFMGYVPDAATLCRDLSCFVMTSHREGLPTALLEAMAVRTPIAFMEGEGGLIDLAELNRTEGPIAVVLPKGDEQGLADGIVRLLDHPEEAHALAERAFAVGCRHFSVESVASKLMAIYRKVANA